MYHPRPGAFRTVAAGIAVLALVFTLAPAPRATSSAPVVISQVYGAGGNAGAVLTHDYVELFNRSASPVSLAGWSIQYTSATGTGNFGAGANQITELPAVTLQPGQYYLVQQSGGANGTPLPAADLIDPTPIAMAAGAGKVALVSSAAGLGCNGSSTPCSVAQLALIVDLVGYGNANFFEGTGAAPGIGATTAAFRAAGGCTDTDDNAADFTAAAPAPRNSASAFNTCGGPPPPPPLPALSIDDVSALEGDSGTTTFAFTVSLSAPAPAGGVVFDIATEDGTAHVSDADYVHKAESAVIPEGQSSYPFSVVVNGDTVIEPNEIFYVNVTNIAGATAAKAQGIGTIVNDDQEAEPGLPELPDLPVVISQVYGGGGNSGAPYRNDFIELFNRGITPVSLDGWSVQYASATGTSWNVTLLSGTLQPGQYYLVQQAAGANDAPALPAPDAIGGTNMSATAGKIALVAATSGLTGACPAVPSIVDFVGFGGTANCREGAAPTVAPSNTNSIHRKQNGCQDTDQNGEDFAAAPPAPRNSATPAAACHPIPLLISIDSVSVAEGDAGTSPATFTVSLNKISDEPVTFDIATADGTATVADNDYEARSLTAQTIPAGEQTYTFTVPIVGDLHTEPHEQFTVTLSNISGALAWRATGTGTIVNDDFPFAAIHQIQGSGVSTPYAGQDVMTSGIVTARKNNGFFLQTPDGQDDGNPETSEGLFVFTGTAPLVSVSVGDAVMVKGTATEFFDLTQIVGTAAGAVTVTSSGHPLPAPVLLTPEILRPDADPAQPQLERFEGMRVAAAALVAVAPTNNFAEIETVLAGVPRPMREPGIDVTAPVPPDPETGVVDCCIPRWDRNPERFMVDTDGLAGAAPIIVSSLATLSNVVGPLDFAFERYKVLPEASMTVTGGMTVSPVPAAAGNEFTVGSYNIQNFGGATTQRRKAALHIRTVMRAPDILGVIEIGSLEALQALAAQIDEDAVAAGEPAPGYEAYLIPFVGTQHVGYLVKSTRVQVHSVTQELTGEILPETGAVLHDRPPLVLRATVDPQGTHPGEVIVLVNHTRSFIDADLVGGDGPRVRAKRTRQAESIAALLQDLQLTNPGIPVVSVGDYNAFQFSDGYTDPIAILKGLGTDTTRVVVWGSDDLVTPDFVNLTDTLPADQQYTYIFEGTPQALDHVLVNTVAFERFQRYTVARSNADFAGHPTAGLAGDPSRPEANSDHDSPLAYFALPGTMPWIRDFTITPSVLGPPSHQLVDVALSYTVTSPAGTVACVPSVTSSEAPAARGSGGTAADWEVVSPSLVRLRAERAGSGPGRTYTITLTCTDAAGHTSQANALATVPHDRR